MTISAINRTKFWLLCGLVASSAIPAHAIVRWNQGKDQVFVRGSVSVTWDTNIFASAAGGEDYVYSGQVGLDYRRHAGLIGVNASANVNFSEFSSNTTENFKNPDFSLEFNKNTGRTTGTLGLNFKKSTRADPTVNLRTDSYVYGANLKFKYPVSERHSLAGGLGWNKQDYTDNNQFVDNTSSTLSADWFYVLSPTRDIFGGYRLRSTDTSRLTSYLDHSFTAGVSGRILPGLNGTARVGYQVRNASGATAENYTGYNAAISASWSFTRKLALSAQIAEDFNLTSTDLSTDSLTASLNLQYARSAKLNMGVGVSGGINKFLGIAGGGREDTFASAYARVSYTFSERLRLGLVYSYFINWSTLPFADFDRQSLTFDASSQF
ncbi:surface lipoprotein assembly modifier [Synoicihabitans lomoniglobus]|uniref:Outer membrane beta-barrel protein n=1 Tax=Synoicihabitans lomoniglobus TaxID=2909285 RepID=A0AAF0I520_9BACT|nr:outer membrane beta-barrel protein [Opitutaceae bacterium LMO-M01]WED67138.1 outer membrane beta-barrel protein [Opitutaceae bacterium LMO-M01]